MPKQTVMIHTRTSGSFGIDESVADVEEEGEFGQFAIRDVYCHGKGMRNSKNGLCEC